MRLNALISTLLGVLFVVYGCLHLAHATSIPAPSTKYGSIPKDQLVQIMKEEYLRVGLVVQSETTSANEHSEAVQLRFDLVTNGQLALADAIELLVVSQGPRANECVLWSCEVWFPGPKTHDQELSREVWAAYQQAMSGVEARVLRLRGTVERNGW